MNNHAGWGPDGLCVWCGTSTPTGACDPRAVIDALRADAARAAGELRHAYRAPLLDRNLIARAIRILERADIPPGV